MGERGRLVGGRVSVEAGIGRLDRVFLGDGGWTGSEKMYEGV